MPELPAGAVTFLFTDIEGSTRLVKQLRDRWGDVVAEHQRLLRAAFENHRGHEIDTQGDAFFVAFASARDAVLAALEAQRALSSYPWPDQTALKVRIGIHTGQAAPVNGRYTGLAVHRAARICAAGHGGQVLVSQATQTLLEDEEEDLGVRVDDLGDQRLKDLDRSVHLYQLSAPGLAEEFPPLRTEAPAPAAEPVPPFYRRRRVIALGGLAVAIVAAIAVLLATRSGGPGGIGNVNPNNAGVIDPKSSTVVAAVPTGIRPGPVAIGAGAVWVANLGDRTLTRIDSKTRAQAATISLGDRTPTGVAVSSGAVWVAHGLLGSVSQVDPRYNRVVKTTPAAARSDAGFVAVGGDSVWAVFGNSTLVRISPDGRVAGEGFAGSEPSGIVYAQGAVWVANSGDATVQRFNPATFTSGPVSTVTVGRHPSAIAYGEGSIWVANAGDGTLSRIDPSSNSAQTIPVGSGPSAVAVSSGAVWVANAGDGTVSRVDPQTNRVVKTIHVGNLPAGLAAGDGFVWLTVQST